MRSVALPAYQGSVALFDLVFIPSDLQSHQHVKLSITLKSCIYLFLHLRTLNLYFTGLFVFLVLIHLKVTLRRRAKCVLEREEGGSEL